MIALTAADHSRGMCPRLPRCERKFLAAMAPASEDQRARTSSVFRSVCYQGCAIQASCNRVTKGLGGSFTGGSPRQVDRSSRGRIVPVRNKVNRSRPVR